MFDSCPQKYQKRLKKFVAKLHDEGIYWDNKIQVATSHLAKSRNQYEEMEKKISYMRLRLQQVRDLMRNEAEQSQEVRSGI